MSTLTFQQEEVSLKKIKEYVEKYVKHSETTTRGVTYEKTIYNNKKDLGNIITVSNVLKKWRQNRDDDMEDDEYEFLWEKKWENLNFTYEKKKKPLGKTTPEEKKTSTVKNYSYLHDGIQAALGKTHVVHVSSPSETLSFDC